MVLRVWKSPWARPLRRCLQGLAKLHGHFVPAVAQGSGANYLTQMGRCRAAARGGDFDLAVLPDREAVAKQEGDAAEREVARRDLVGGVGAGAVEDLQDGFALERSARLAAAVALRGRGGQPDGSRRGR